MEASDEGVASGITRGTTGGTVEVGVEAEVGVTVGLGETVGDGVGVERVAEGIPVMKLQRPLVSLATVSVFHTPLTSMACIRSYVCNSPAGR